MVNLQGAQYDMDMQTFFFQAMEGAAGIVIATAVVGIYLLVRRQFKKWDKVWAVVEEEFPAMSKNVKTLLENNGDFSRRLDGHEGRIGRLENPPISLVTSVPRQ